MNQGVCTAAALPIRILVILGERQIFLKDVLTVMMVYSSFKTACYNWSRVNSPKIRILNRSIYLLEGVDVSFFSSCRPCVRGQRLVPQSSHHRSQGCAIVPPNPKWQPMRASSGFLILDNAIITSNSWSSGGGCLGVYLERGWFDIVLIVGQIPKIIIESSKKFII